MSMSRIISCIAGREYLLWTSVLSWHNSVSLCPASFCTPRPNLLLFQVSFDFLLVHSRPLWWKRHLFWVLVLESLIGIHRTIPLQLLQDYWLGHRLGILILNGPWEATLWTKIVEAMEFRLSYFKSWKMMLWKYCIKCVNKFAKLSNSHRTGKDQFSFHFQRKAMPMIV